MGLLGGNHEISLFPPLKISFFRPRDPPKWIPRPHFQFLVDRFSQAKVLFGASDDDEEDEDEDKQEAMLQDLMDIEFMDGFAEDGRITI